jgi:hypothetical protein
MKNVSVYVNETKEIVGSPKSQAYFDSASKMKAVRSQWRNISPQMSFFFFLKQKFNVYEHFSTMAKKSTTMLQQFVKTNVLLKNMDAQIGHLIDKL